jgi:glycosyltransferase involved in cell wall biosynthesis
VTPKLSLCIATLNRAPYLDETLRTIAAQAHPDVEVVVVDGGSTDGTSDVVERFRGQLPSLRYERRLEPGGVDRDFDRAVELASGEYCWLCSDDDLLKPGALGTVLARLSQREFALLVVNAAIYNEDFSTLVHERAVSAGEDRVYEAGDDERLFTDAGRYLSYIGAVVVRRDLWRARAREPYFGSLFIHVGVLFQAPLPAAAVLLAEPLIAIRYGNAGWTARAFEIWMFKWPLLIWSFGQFGADVKAAVSPREPYRTLKTLLLFRGKGAYTLRDYRAWIKPHLPFGPRRWQALAVAVLPGMLCNVLMICGIRLLYPQSGVALIDLRKSRYNILRRLKAQWPARPAPAREA